jgi:hypothetical protein
VWWAGGRRFLQVLQLKRILGGEERDAASLRLIECCIGCIEERCDPEVSAPPGYFARRRPVI